MNNVISKLGQYVRNPLHIYETASAHGLTRWVPDETHLKIMFKARMGSDLNLAEPITFNEKLQWLKIHDRNPFYTTLVDKYSVKTWVADRIGEKYVTPTYAVWEDVEDVDITGLPECFVLKTNNDSGGVVICRDRDAFDLAAAKRKLSKSFRHNYYWRTREWPYKDVKPVVFAEEYLKPGDGSAGIPDYKVMCFGGDPLCEFTCTGRAAGDLRVDFFDNEWKHLPFTRHYPNADVFPDPPENLLEMLQLARKLATGIPFVRVDFYEVNGRLLFGEMTFYPGNGMEEFDPFEWDKRMGSWIDLKHAFNRRRIDL